MSPRTPFRLAAEPPRTVLEALRNRLSGRELQAFGTVFAVRTAAQQMDNAITEWMADSAASPARFQILALLWAANGHPVPHKEIVASLGVTRATISELMAALERDDLLQSSVALDDRRNLLANLTSRGKAVVEKAIETNAVRLRAAFAALSTDELTILTTLLQRVREGFAANFGAAEGRKPEGADRTAAEPVKQKAGRSVRSRSAKASAIE